MSVLEAREVAFSYEGKTVLSGVNFTIEQGDYLCVVGENGAGKSTLMKGILGLKKVADGQLSMGDGLRANEIGYLPQQSLVQKDFPASVYEVVLSGCLNSLGKRFFYSKEQKKLAQENIELLGITSIKEQCYRELSGGQQQRVLLARALCATKKILLLDEPVAGLDPIVSAEFYELVRKLNQEKKITIIMVSHDIAGVMKDASHVLHLGMEQLFFGTTADYRESNCGKRFMEEEVDNESDN